MNTPYVFEYIPFPAVPGNPRNGEGDVVKLAGGGLLMVYAEFAGPSDHSAATLQGVFSPDHGRSWHDKHTVQENIGGRNVMAASLLRLSSGEILLAFLRKDQEGSHCTPFVKLSREEGKSWSVPEPVTPVTDAYYVVNNDRVIQLSSGRVVMPAQMNLDRAPRGDVVFFSDDLGRSWHRTEPHEFLPESRTGAQEPGLVELLDGRIMMWCRCDLGEIYRCYSEDGGETFGPWTPMGLKAPCSPSTIKRIPGTTALLCVFNNHEEPPEYWAVPRAPLTAAISIDEAASWRIVGDLEPDRTRAYCYTSVTFLSNGEILLTYYHGETVDRVEDGRFKRGHRNLAHLKVAVFESSWLGLPREQDTQ